MLHNIEKYSFTFFIALAVFYCNICFAFDDDDFQYWNTENFSFKINDDWKAGLEEEFRFGDDLDDFYYQHSDVGAVYSGVAKWLDIGGGYRHIYEKKNSDWKMENRPYFYGTLKKKFTQFTLSNRLRFEYRNREDAQELW